MPLIQLVRFNDSAITAGIIKKARLGAIVEKENESARLTSPKRDEQLACVGLAKFGMQRKDGLVSFHLQSN
jgi:hypothetical protein